MLKYQLKLCMLTGNYAASYIQKSLYHLLRCFLSQWYLAQKQDTTKELLANQTHTLESTLNDNGRQFSPKHCKNDAVSASICLPITFYGNLHGHPACLLSSQPTIQPACLLGKAKKGWRPIIDLTQLVISFHSCYFVSKVCTIYSGSV